MGWWHQTNQAQQGNKYFSKQKRMKNCQSFEPKKKIKTVKCLYLFNFFNYVIRHESYLSIKHLKNDISKVMDTYFNLLKVIA